MSAETWLTLGIVGFLMSFVKSAFGLGSGALFVPVMVLFMDPKLAVVSTVPLMLLSGLMTIRTYWGRWHWPVLQPLVLATLAGVLAGSALLVRLPADIVRKLVGTAALLFAGTQLYRLLGTEIAAASDGDGAGWGRALAYGVGAVGGFVSAIAHSGGIIYSFYLLPRLSQAEFVASLALLALGSDALKLISFWQAGALTWTDVWAGLVLSPLLALGTWLGRRVNRNVSARAFIAVISALLLVVGVLLLVR